MSTDTAKRKAIQRVLDSAMQWHYQLTRGPLQGADYHAYCRSFERLKRACARLKKVSK